ncbi:hypothetical protein [Microvirga sp. 2YAF29]|uniref:hypothetical protein n=1 Tax=Microvirga sp. 2YAF29 TaxID=3233031 RepID=UPI003F97DD50
MALRIDVPVLRSVVDEDAQDLFGKRLGFTQTGAQRDLGDISNSVEYFFEKNL